jgi:hypothetical protein
METCETCRHWRRSTVKTFPYEEDGSLWSDCNLASEEAGPTAKMYATAADDYGLALRTRADFGCTEHEAI